MASISIISVGVLVLLAALVALGWQITAFVVLSSQVFFNKDKKRIIPTDETVSWIVSGLANVGQMELLGNMFQSTGLAVAGIAIIMIGSGSSSIMVGGRR
jgi:hypothetical protein